MRVYLAIYLESPFWTEKWRDQLCVFKDESAAVRFRGEQWDTEEGSGAQGRGSGAQGREQWAQRSGAVLEIWGR